MEVQITNENPPIIIGAKGRQEIEQNIRIIIQTYAFSVPLDRAFADAAGFIDAPTPCAAARKIAELTEAIEKYEPRVKVESITYRPDPAAASDGTMFPVIRYKMKD